MSAHRFFLESPLAHDADSALGLSDADVHHAVDVLRLRIGEEIDVVEPGGGVWRLRVTEAGRHGVFAARLGEVAVTQSPHVTLFQGVAKGEKMDDIVRQAVEIGAEKIVPVLTARSVVQLDASKRAARGERWRRVALAAAKQAKRASVPAVSDPMSLADAVPLLAAFDAAIVLWEEGVAEGVAEAVSRCAGSPQACVALIVGPEGGLAAEEVAALEAIGATAASLGPTILRTETAAVVALALAIAALGGLGNAHG
jgi:16S rRNA (uracil1498-N3)-methyltransferase